MGSPVPLPAGPGVSLTWFSDPVSMSQAPPLALCTPTMQMRANARAGGSEERGLSRPPGDARHLLGKEEVIPWEMA